MLRKRKKRPEKNKCLVIKAGEESRNQKSIKLWEMRNEEKVNTNAAQSLKERQTEKQIKFGWLSLVAFERAVTVRSWMCKPG